MVVGAVPHRVRVGKFGRGYPCRGGGRGSQYASASPAGARGTRRAADPALTGRPHRHPEPAVRPPQQQATARRRAGSPPDGGRALRMAAVAASALMAGGGPVGFGTVSHPMPVSRVAPSPAPLAQASGPDARWTRRRLTAPAPMPPHPRAGDGGLWRRAAWARAGRSSWPPTAPRPAAPAWPPVPGPASPTVAPAAAGPPARRRVARRPRCRRPPGRRQASGWPMDSKYSRVTLKTIGASNSSPMRLGTAINPLRVSDRFHTRSTFTLANVRAASTHNAR